jgi:hypothetical protein
VGSSTETCNEENTVWYLKEIDMQFKNPSAVFSWQFGPGAPSTSQYDFQSVALHELGHAHGLAHTIAAEKVMHFSLAKGTSIRTLSWEEIAGGLAKMAYSTTETCFNSAGSGTPIRTGQCSKPVNLSTCSGGNVLLTLINPGIGTSYQWQLDTTAGYTNLDNNVIYSGVKNDSLKLTSVPSHYADYRYRCIITNGSAKDTSSVFTVSFVNVWNGNINNTWGNPSNWSCGIVPDAFTSVLIKEATPVYPVISSNAACKSIDMATGSSLQVKTGSSLNVSGKTVK